MRPRPIHPFKSDLVKIVVIVSVFLFFVVAPSFSVAQINPDPPGPDQENQHQGPQESHRYEFGNNLAFQIQSQENVSFTLLYDNFVSNRFLGMKLNNTEPANISIYYQGSFSNPPQNQIRNGKGNAPWSSQDSPGTVSLQSAQFLQSSNDYLNIDSEFDFATYFTLTLDSSKVDGLEVYTYLNYTENILQKDLDEYIWAYYEPTSEEWRSLDTQVIDGGIQFALDGDVPDTLTISVVHIQAGAIVPPPGGELTPLQWFLIVAIPLIVIVFGIMMTTQEYREFLLNRVLHIDKGPHRLTMEDVLENENRNAILDLIIARPGVHFNEILRETNLSAGNLAWHLDILETFKVVRKQRVGQYLMYYPYYEKNPISKLDPALQKSRTTLEILQIINDHPGIYQNQIAHRMDLDHKTVKYHIDKLIDAGIIWAEKNGRKKNYYPDNYIEET